MDKPTYYTMNDLLDMIHGPCRAPCQRLYAENRERFMRARGSTHNHQAWPGGYHDHLQDGMNVAVLLYRAAASTGRCVPFSLSDALVAFFLHDLEKPWRFKQDEDGAWINDVAMETKAHRQAFRESKMEEYGIKLAAEIENAVRYAEGEGADYRSDIRVSNELAGFVHACDHWSARVWHDHPQEDGVWGFRTRLRP